ncbi:NADP-dependent oxidoreductase [Glutamicibacter sp. MNS18]|uniref:NADP-dependent oxidoreductase n=1 Tax=Glutamicibacter sp. MNS18 TaxID=2989817 RepID=UPI00223614D0|nr:NADP-dependent oxidoreductase [Glutamicibacter sp. MNS18]MCW4464274.1 NADP-dependent oxidoreductase [Glutamicibacter sp. MNS18]
MKAFVLEKYRSPLRQIDMPEPVPGDHEVLVRMSAAGINHADERVRTGEFARIFPFALPLVMGSEFAGEVIATGKDVEGFPIGMQVFAYVDLAQTGGFAEVIAIDQKHLAPAPRSASLVEAASLPVVGLTAWQGLVNMGQLRKGQTVLIHGGSGGVGAIAIQLAKHLGATVATTVSSANADFVRDLGADIVIDYGSEDFAQRVRDVDLVLDTQGGDVLKKSLGVLRPGGTVIGITGPPDPDFAKRVGVKAPVKLAITALSAGIRRRARRQGVTYRFLFIEPNGEHLRHIAGLIDQSVLRPIVDRVEPFERTPQALEAVLTGGHRGKIVVSTQPTDISHG